MDKVYQIPKTEINKIIRDFIDMPDIEIFHDLNMKNLMPYRLEIFKDYDNVIIAIFDRKFKTKLKKIGLGVE